MVVLEIRSSASGRGFIKGRDGNAPASVSVSPTHFPDARDQAISNVTIQGKNHEWTRIHTNEGEGIGTPVSAPGRYECEESRRVGDRRAVLGEGDGERELGHCQ
jgi:hypothetical protein